MREVAKQLRQVDVRYIIFIHSSATEPCHALEGSAAGAIPAVSSASILLLDDLGAELSSEWSNGLLLKPPNCLYCTAFIVKSVSVPVAVIGETATKHIWFVAHVAT